MNDAQQKDGDAEAITRHLIIGNRNAYEFLMTATEQELADVFFRYGAERAAAKIAREIVDRRAAGKLPITTTHFQAMITGLLHPPMPKSEWRVSQAARVAAERVFGVVRFWKRT